jgi:hypothetical protein
MEGIAGAGERTLQLGRHVSPGQLAAMLLERSLFDLEPQREKLIASPDSESAQKL